MSDDVKQPAQPTQPNPETANGPAAAPKDPAEAAKPKRFSDILVRIASGAVYLVVMIGSVMWGNIPTALMLSVASGICAFEFYRMLRRDAKLPNELVGIVTAVLYAPVALWLHLGGMAVLTLLLMLTLLVWYVFYQRARITDVCLSFFGAIYTGMLPASALLIRPVLDEPWGGVVLLIIFLSVWLNDILAYLVGSAFGKHKLAPKVSPNKSWEGFVAGVMASMLTWLLMLLVPGVAITWWEALIFGLVCGLLGVIGDLAESRMKRNSGVKDSGTIMPGHGGLLDRMDSLFLAMVTSAILLIGCGCIPPFFS